MIARPGDRVSGLQPGLGLLTVAGILACVSAGYALWGSDGDHLTVTRTAFAAAILFFVAASQLAARAAMPVDIAVWGCTWPAAPQPAAAPLIPAQQSSAQLAPQGTSASQAAAAPLSGGAVPPLQQYQPPPPPPPYTGIVVVST